MNGRAEEMRALRAQLHAARSLSPQAAHREWDIAQMEAQLRILEAKRELEVAERAWLLLEAYRKTGHMRVRIGDETRDISPVVTSNAVQNVWNVKYKAMDAAAWSIP